ncbi:hypothetical protein COCNU_04G011550 [Cocos nucifera]|uniref:Uncharacterized protein n=1 Tax=Cocos nucifera TaxID=13894 RepID=A0A8K0I7J6_COCNU|nr:hypothetical protein COCNU_04G011550 [Cocos nucifera]
MAPMQIRDGEIKKWLGVACGQCVLPEVESIISYKGELIKKLYEEARRSAVMIEAAWVQAWERGKGMKIGDAIWRVLKLQHLPLNQLELRSWLKKVIAVLQTATAHIIYDLLWSLEAGAITVQESFESINQAIDGFVNRILVHG